MKYLIETHGCQMNVHDSERMAGLLEQAGYEPATDDVDADVIVINTCSVRERAEEKLFTRLGEIRQQGLEHGTRPVVAVAGCVAQQEGKQILARSSAVDVVIGTQNIKRLPMLVEQAAANGAGGRPIVDIDPLDDVSFPLGVARRADPAKAYVTIIEGCNEFCAFCVVPYTRGHERMRPAAAIVAEARQAVAEGAIEIQLLGQIVNHYQAPDDASCDFAALLARLERDRRTGAHSLRQPASPARHPAHDWRDARPVEGVPAPAPAGAIGLDARPRPDAAPPHARRVPGARRQPPSRHAGHRALDRYDRRVPGRDGRRLRGDDVADGGGPLPQHVLVQVFAAAQHARDQAAGRTM